MRGVAIAALLLAVAAGAEEERLLPACGASKCSGTVLMAELGLLRICVPRGVKSKTAFGEHGDRHTRLIVMARWKRHELYIVTGPYFPGKDPRHGDTRWTVSKWRCSGGLKVEDYRLTVDRLQTRYVALNPQIGYARYDGVPPDVALRFDKILDTLCCGECTVCSAKP